ncbi:UNVERIFIED_CONTAM: hypothetical protein Sangu_1314700 [Sesamum angustifolium]|uniref:DUF4216 domain-containing protein n=1 Tax=Sesamum angustifolium TaxID=2727405 RepID=A0AAW2NN18_9LAMI
MKKSIFLDLPYWSTLFILHNIDVMHIEKNVFDNIFNTVMDIKGKTKDNMNARRDLKMMCNRPELELDEHRPNVMPKAVYTLGNEQKMRSHDYHVFMQKLIPIAFLEMLPEHVWSALTEVHPELNYTDKELLKYHYWGLSAEVTLFHAYFVNGYNFPTERHNTGKSTMNCRVCVKSSLYTDEENNFYGVIKEIIQLTYPLIPNLHIMLFKCRWVDPVRGMQVHPSYHLVDVNFKKLYQKDDPFILAQQAVQVYFTEYPSMKRDKVDWMAVRKIKARRVVDDSK